MQLSIYLKYERFFLEEIRIEFKLNLKNISEYSNTCNSSVNCQDNTCNKNRFKGDCKQYIKKRSSNDDITAQKFIEGIRKRFQKLKCNLTFSCRNNS